MGARTGSTSSSISTSSRPDYSDGEGYISATSSTDTAATETSKPEPALTVLEREAKHNGGEQKDFEEAATRDNDSAHEGGDDFHDSSASHIYDTAIVGAGPTALALAARLREPLPASSFSDAEHQRLWPRIKSIDWHPDSAPSRGSTRRPTKPRAHLGPLDLVAIDPAGSWLANWHVHFRRLEIRHLRSPLFLHLDPAQPDSLLARAVAHEHGDVGTGSRRSTSAPMVEIPGCVGREVSKHQTKKKRLQKKHGAGKANERERHDYFAASTEVFGDHVDELVQRYGLRDSVVKDAVVDIGIDSADGLFILSTRRGATIRAKSVAICVGNGPRVPPELQWMLQPGYKPSPPPRWPPACHALDLSVDFARASAAAVAAAGHARPSSAVVIGGGLSAAQVVHLLLSKGWRHVTLLSRKAVKCQPFDLPLGWMLRFRNGQQAEWYGLDSDAERSAALAQARPGGSMPSSWFRLLQRYEGEGRVQMVVGEVDAAASEWQRDAGPAGARVRAGRWQLAVQTREEEPLSVAADMVVLATGQQPAPLVERVRAKFSPGGPGSLELSDELEAQQAPDSPSGWLAGSGLFVLGSAARFKLGPAAGNLMGSRAGAERAAQGIERRVRERGRSVSAGQIEQKGEVQVDGASDNDRSEHWRAYLLGHGSRYAALAEE